MTQVAPLAKSLEISSRPQEETHFVLTVVASG
jgi:hypothetical protein